MHSRLALLVLAAAALVALPAQAQPTPSKMFKCVDAKGKTYYTQTPPKECADRVTQELSRSGRVVKQTEILTDAQIEAREVEKK